MSEKFNKENKLPHICADTKEVIEQVKLLTSKNSGVNMLNSENLLKSQATGFHHLANLKKDNVGEDSANSNLDDVSTVAGASKSLFEMRRRLNDKDDVLPSNLRKSFIANVAASLFTGELTNGEALRLLRMKAVGLKQTEYAKLVGVSRRTLSDFENDMGVTKTDVINKLFKPFGLRVGIVPIKISIWNEL